MVVGTYASGSAETQLLGRVASRYALKKATEAYFGQPVLDIKYSELGKPSLRLEPNTSVSISHCDSRGIVALSEKPVGIDIEKIRNVTPSLKKYVLNPGEAALIRRIFKGEVTFICAWAVKEAVAKAAGLGFNIPPKSITIKEIIENMFLVDIDFDSTSMSSWLVSVQIENGFALAVASPVEVEIDDAEREVTWYRLP